MIRTISITVIIVIVLFSYTIKQSHEYGYDSGLLKPFVPYTVDPLMVTTDQNNYTSMGMITITAHVSNPNNTVPLVIKILNKFDLPVVFHAFTPSTNQSYILQVLPVGPLFNTSGNYTVSSQYGSYHASTYFQFTNINTGIVAKYSSPLTQFKSGIKPEDIHCKSDFVLIIKSEDNSPACVKPDTAQKLVERGWTKMIFKTGIAINSYTSVSNGTKKTPEVVDNITYLSQTVDEWKNKTPEQLDTYYKKYKDAFYTELGSFLIKDEMKKELERQKIQNIHDDFKVFPGMSLDSLPPHIGYNAVVNATDGNSYLLLGGVFANKVESLKITKLVFDKDALNSLSTGKKPSYTNPDAKTTRVVISDQEGTKSPVEPYNLALDSDKNNIVTFYNNSTVPIRIQPHGSGLTVDEGGLNWKSKVFGPNETMVIQFNKTGYYEWDARSPPQGSENWWDYKGGGQIAAFLQSHDSSTATDKLKMAQVFVTDSDIPWSSTGLDGYGNLEISLYESVYYMIPDAQKYYSIRAMQLIPFDVSVIISSPSFTEK